MLKYKIFPVLPRTLSILFFGFTAALASQQVCALEPDPRAYFFMSGLTIGKREFQLGDPEKWNTKLKNMSAESTSGKIKAQPEDYQGRNDALHLTWSKNEIQGQLALYGPAVDLSAFKDIAALTMDMKIARKPTAQVTVGMDCGPSCRAETPVDKQLKKEKINKWFAFSIPLNCFKNDGFDFSKISGPFLISTSGVLELSIANIRLVRLPEGEEGCVD